MNRPMAAAAFAWSRRRLEIDFSDGFHGLFFGLAGFLRMTSPFYLLRLGPVYRLCKKYIAWHDHENNDDMFTNGEYEILRSQILPASIVFDVGANRGDWAQAVLRLYPMVELHCFGPCAATFQVLAIQPELTKARLNPCGLGSNEGTSRLYALNDDSGNNSLYLRKGIPGMSADGPRSIETVQLTTLDAHCKLMGLARIDYLKLDVEGHELEVLRGGLGLLQAGRIGRIQFEYGGTNIDSRVLLKDFFELLKQAGFELYKIAPGQLSPSAPICSAWRISNTRTGWPCTGPRSEDARF